MKRWMFAPALLLAALAFAAAGLADPGDSGKGKKQGHNRFTFTLVTDDHGCHGQLWATDTVKRTYVVHDNGDGTFRLRRVAVGTFVTTGPESPNNCATSTGKHGTHVRAGVKGKVIGYLEGTVTPAAGQTFNPKATCGTTACFTDEFLTAFFGAGATFSCNTDSTDCKFNFNYTAAKHQKLRLRHWQDRGTGAVSMLEEHFKGDISQDAVRTAS